MERFDRPRNELALPALLPENQPLTAERARVTYYDRPMVKSPKWRWFIPGYFWIGGIAGGAAAIGAVARLVGGQGGRDTARHARYLSLALAGVSPILLIVDLHRPERFLNMFRVFKVSSPLSVGTWILTGFSMVSGALVARQAAEDSFIIRRESGFGRTIRAVVPEKSLTAVHGVLGLGLGGYTGVLLSVTAIPLWAAGGVFLGPLFLSTAVASGAAALTLLSLAFGQGDKESERIRGTVETVEVVSAATQLALVTARDLTTTRRINQPLRRGRWGLLYRGGAIGGGMVAPIAMRIIARVFGPRATATFSAVAATLTLLGALAERFAIVEAGKVSANDPIAYQELTAGVVGMARPSAREQAIAAPTSPAYRPRIAASDTLKGVAE